MRTRVLAGCLVGGAAVAAPFFPNVPGNLFLIMTGDVFYIPHQSTLVGFRPTVMNAGSGEWWLYGEDAWRLYAVSDENHFTYLYVPRDKLSSGMDPQDKATWGAVA